MREASAAADRRNRERARERDPGSQARAQTQVRAQDRSRNHQSGSASIPGGRRFPRDLQDLQAFDARADRRSGSRGIPALAEPLKSFRELGRPELEPADAVVDDNDRVVAVFVGNTAIDLEGAVLERSANDELVTA